VDGFDCGAVSKGSRHRIFLQLEVFMNIHLAPDTKNEAAYVDVEIEVYTEGPDRRAHARARVTELADGTFIVTPFYFREISGPNVRWYSPARGMPILTAMPIMSLDQARNILSFWAMQTFAENASRPPTGIAIYRDGDRRPDDPHTLLERMSR
jgi:hypothetical protein